MRLPRIGSCRWFAPAVVAGTLGLGALGAGSAARGQESAGGESFDASEAAAVPTEGLWPTQRMIELVLRRGAREIGKQYDLDEEQAEQLGEQVLYRWPRFLNEHRAVIQTLANEVIEAQLEAEFEGTPPDLEKIKGWAARVLPTFRALTGELDEGLKEFREILNPDQQRKLDRESMMFKTGLALAEGVLGRWVEGDIRGDELGEFGIRARSRTEGIRLDEWETFVVAFGEKHAFDDAQTTTALAVLDDLTGQAERYRLAHEEELAALAVEISEAEPDARQALQDRRSEIRKPIDQLFANLKDRLNSMLTPAQRREAHDRRQNRAPDRPTERDQPGQRR